MRGQAPKLTHNSRQQCPKQKDQPDAGAGDAAQRSRSRGCDVEVEGR